MIFPRRHDCAGSPPRAFTLIEIMIVVAIMAIIMAISIPFAYQALRRDAFNQTLRDMEEIFANARAQAIMQGSKAEVVIHKDKFDLSAPAATTNSDSISDHMEANLAASAHSGRSAQITDKVGIAALKINGVSFMDAEEARVRFYPNGTCDELRIVLINMDNREMRGIFLEVTTGLATINSDANTLLKEVK